eukprot:scaffold4041_cov117-Skeletonema_dohrnii-CCMP3373.AAC.13
MAQYASFDYSTKELVYILQLTYKERGSSKPRACRSAAKIAHIMGANATIASSKGDTIGMR